MSEQGFSLSAVRVWNVATETFRPLSAMSHQEHQCKAIIKDQLIIIKLVIDHISCPASSLIVCFCAPQLGTWPTTQDQSSALILWPYYHTFIGNACRVTFGSAKHYQQPFDRDHPLLYGLNPLLLRVVPFIFSSCTPSIEMASSRFILPLQSPPFGRITSTK